MIKKYGHEIQDGTWINCYNGTINKNVCGTILTGVSYRNLYFVAVEEENETDKNPHKE